MTQCSKVLITTYIRQADECSSMNESTAQDMPLYNAVKHTLYSKFSVQFTEKYKV